MKEALGRLLRHPLRALGSLRATTVLLLLAAVVLFAGTLAEGRQGVAVAQRRFFRSWGTMVGPLPFPGLRSLAAAAAVNLLLALVLKRRQLLRDPGLALTHVGLLAVLAAAVAEGAAGGGARGSSDLSFVALREGARAESALDPGAWDLVLEPAGVVVPFERLRDGAPVPGEPSVVVEEHLVNSRPLVAPSGDQLTSLAPLRPEADPVQNRPGVIVRPASGARPAPVVVWAGRRAEVGGVTATLARRELRLPFALTLKRLQVSYYPQTETLRAVSAAVLVDGAGPSAEVALGMNRTLRRAGLNVSVSSVGTDEGGRRVLVLGVSRSPVLLYLALALVLIGLAVRFALRRAPLAAPLAILLLAPPQPAGARELPPLGSLGRVAVLSGGRLMPLETYARLTLRELSGSSRVNRESALSWMARVLFAPDTTLADPVFAVRRRETLGRLRLSGVAAGRLSFDQLEPAEARLQDLADRLSGRKDRQPADQEILSLMSRLSLFTRLVASADYLRPHPDFTVPAGAVSARLGLSPGRHSLREVAARRGRLAGPWEAPADAAAARRLRGALARWRDDYRGVVPAIVPLGEGWTNEVAALASGEDESGASEALARAADAYTARDWRAMRAALSDLEASVARAPGVGGRLRAVRLEVVYDGMRPFAVGIVLHCLGLLVLAFGGAWRPARVTAAAALALGLLAFTAGLVLQALITARPPAATLAQTFLLAAWALSLAGVAALAARGGRAAAALGCGAGLLLAVVGRVIAASGDEFAVLPAALDANLWLAVHVGLISLGYAASLAAAALGHLWLARRCLRPDDAAAADRLQAALRAALAAALLLTAAGTLAGAAWAEIAWGRFWDWDPKENGALIVILWIAAVLHSARARSVGPAVTAGAAAALSLVVLLSWVGVNMMRVGLHSYGFVSGGAAAVAVACAAEGAFLAAAALMLRRRPPRAGADGLVWRRPRD